MNAQPDQVLHTSTSGQKLFKRKLSGAVNNRQLQVLPAVFGLCNNFVRHINPGSPRQLMAVCRQDGLGRSAASFCSPFLSVRHILARFAAGDTKSALTPIQKMPGLEKRHPSVSDAKVGLLKSAAARTHDSARGMIFKRSTSNYSVLMVFWVVYASSAINTGI